MALRVLVVQPARPVSTVISHLPPPISASRAISRTCTPCQLHKLLCYHSSARELSSAIFAHGTGTGAARCLHLGGKFSRGSVNWESFNDFAKSRFRTVSPLMSASASEAQTLSMEEEESVKTEEKIINHQRAAAKLDRKVEARTVVDKIGNGILSTNSKRWDGFPVPSMVPYAAEESGTILLCVSSLSPHTADLEANSKCSFLVAKDLNDRSDLVVTIIGQASNVSDEGTEAAKSIFLKKHPGAFWVDFGDFKMFRIEPKEIRYVSGIVTGTATVSQFSGEEYKSAVVDPISQFSGPIAHHMNADHADQTRMIVEHNTGIKVDSAIITDVDSLGLYVASQRQRKPLKLRIPFPRKAENRKDVKTLIVEMLAACDPQEK